MNTRDKLNSVSVRHASESDISGMIKIEISRYSEIYTDKESIEKTRKRFQKRMKIAKEWMWVAEQNGRVTGFITGQPTDSEPKDFKSWEESTDNGTLENTFNESGKNVYVVNLDVTREASKANVQYMLMAQLGSKSIRLGMTKVIFESRMPEFRDFVLNEKRVDLKEWESFSDKKKVRWAEDYSKMKVQRNDKTVLKDRLLRFYDSGGFTLEKIFANAFEDPESLDFGMLCTAKNPIPKMLRIAPINLTFSKIFAKIGNNPNLLSKLIG